MFYAMSCDEECNTLLSRVKTTSSLPAVAEVLLEVGDIAANLRILSAS